jgi:hypothetical protein
MKYIFVIGGVNSGIGILPIEALAGSQSHGSR